MSQLLTSPLVAILRDQAGMITRLQLRDVGVPESTYRARLASGRWRSLNDSVICTHNGPLTREQAEWAAVLSAHSLVALCGLTTMQRFGVRGFDTPSIHILVERGARPLPVAGVDVVVHESRRFAPIDVLPRLPPTTGLERATIDARSGLPTSRPQ